MVVPPLPIRDPGQEAPAIKLCRNPVGKKLAQEADSPVVGVVRFLFGRVLPPGAKEGIHRPQNDQAETKKKTTRWSSICQPKMVSAPSACAPNSSPTPSPMKMARKISAPMMPQYRIRWCRYSGMAKAEKNRQKDEEVIYGQGFFEGISRQKQDGVVRAANRGHIAGKSQRDRHPDARPGGCLEH